MNTLKKLITLTFLSLLLSACDNKGSHTSKKQEEVYDFRNEKYQDFYSRLARSLEEKKLNVAIGKNGLEKPFDKTYINQVLDLSIQEDIFFRLSIDRMDPKNYHKMYDPDNHVNDENDLAIYREIEFKSNANIGLSEYEICKDDLQIEGLFCLNKIRGNKIRYYYFPKKSTKKIPYINQSLSFFCEYINSAHGRYIHCELSNYTDHPYNLYIYIGFNEKPEDFFRIVEYVESYIYQATGEHIWQTSLKES